MSLKLIYSYLDNRKQRVKVKDRVIFYGFSNIYGFPQASILGSLHFNVFITDLFLVLRNIENYRHMKVLNRRRNNSKKQLCFGN